MEASPQEDAAESSQGELTREKLIQKCKTLLTIAQKAKIARDEALEEKGKLQKQFEDAKNTMTAKENQFKAVEEMLGVLTDQKLKLAMDIDTLKKEKVAFLNQITQLTEEKDHFETEAISLKRQYNRLLTENEDLIGELQIKERSESQLLSDIKKLHENNESVKILCTNVTQEKLHLEEELEKLARDIEAMRIERSNWEQTLGSKYGLRKFDVKSLTDFIDTKIANGSPQSQATSDSLSTDLSDQLEAFKKENESLHDETKSMKEKIQRLMSELETANVDRDQMMANLEGVRVETKTLIENVEKLSEEVDAAKVEKTKSESALNQIIESKNGEIDTLLQELSKNKSYISELISSLDEHVANSNKCAELSVKLKLSDEENAQLKIKLSELSKNIESFKETSGGQSATESSILQILKEGICSNLSDLNDTMPEYSKDFLNKLNTIIEGGDCKGGIGADVFVHYFNECLSQLKISLKENEILTKEVSHLKGSIQELESLVDKHNTDCEQLRSEVEELSSDSNRLLHDLGNLRHENLLRASEIGELMMRLKQRDDEVDRLKEMNNQLENERNEQVSILRAELSDLNNIVSQIREHNKELESELKTSRSDQEVQSLKNELESAKKVIESLHRDSENVEFSLAESTTHLETILGENESLKKDLEKFELENQALADDIAILKLKLEEAENNFAKKSSELESTLVELAKLKVDLEQMEISMQEKDSQLREAGSQNKITESLQKNVDELKGAVAEKSCALDKALEDLQAANEKLSIAVQELNQTKPHLEELLVVKNELADLKLNFNTNVEQLQSLRDQLLEKEKLIAGMESWQKNIEIQNEEAVKSLRATVEQLQAELKEKCVETESLRQELEAKLLLEEELAQLKSIQQKTMGELENSKKHLNEGKSARNYAQELEKELKSRNADLERSRKLLAEKNVVETELAKLVEELRGKISQTDGRLKLIADENELLKKTIREAEKTIEEKTGELKIVQEQLRNKELVEENLAEVKEQLRIYAEESIRVGSVSQESDILKSKMIELEQKFAERGDEIERISMELQASEAQKEDLRIKGEKLQEIVAASGSTISDLETRLNFVKEALSLSEEAVEKSSQERNSMVNEIKAITEKADCLQCENDVLREKLSSQASANVLELNKRSADLEKRREEIEALKELLNFKKLELEEINCVWAGRMNSLKVNLTSLARSMNEVGRLSKESLESFVDKMQRLKNDFTFKVETVLENSVAEAKRELVDEMHRMNEALKDRGNSISNLENRLSDAIAKNSSIKSHNEELLSERNKIALELKCKEEKLTSAEHSIKELESEISRLKDMKESVPENDSLSTSTISRTEDNLRFKEVDDSIEEKYNKLRLVAVKLKKKASELTQTLELERNKFATDKAELVDKIQHLSTVAKNAQKVQESYDKILDELETVRKQNQTASTSLKELVASEEQLRRHVASLESQNANIPLMAKQIEGLNHTIKDLKAEVNRLEMEKKVEVMKYEEVKKQFAALESKSESLTLSLDQAVQQSRSTNVLELEINNYEKVIADLTSQLNNEKQKFANSEKECASISLVKNGLEEQLSLLEKQVAAEELRNTNLQEQVTSMRQKANLAQQQIDELNGQVSALRRELQLAKSQNEQQAFEMSSLSSDFSRKEIDLQNKIDSFTSHIQSLETTLATVKQELSTSNSEKEHLREEFDCYRLRAQSMLARQKGDSISQGEKEAREQLDKLKKELDGAREKMENNQTEIETLNNKLSSIQLEKARSDKRYEDITKALHQKITDYDTLNTEYRAFKFSAETLQQNTKTEFEEKEKRLKDEIVTLKDLVDTLSQKTELYTRELDNPGVRDFQHNIANEKLTSESQQFHDGPTVLQEREDGEGSESVPPPMGNFRRLSNLIPLDILLNNPIDDENRIPVLQEQIEKLHGELHSYEVRVKHLASLLSEAEKDAARSSQQNAVLKEELRRLERSLQREPNIANSEYLKNVIFKFLVLQSGDERTRLVPVLDTILKLSPDETSKLTAVAKGEAATWGSYLHSWTGL